MSKPMCKVGDLAISVNTELPENAGLIVEVMAIHVQDPTWGNDHGPLCRVRSAGDRPLHLNLRIAGEWQRQIVREAVVPDSRLLPITPPEGELDEERERMLDAR